MVNQKYMEILAQLESVSCTQAERDAINMVRGKYVQQYGSDNEYVKGLGLLEAAACTQEEKDDINMIRGKYGLFEMTYGVSPTTSMTTRFDENTIEDEMDYDYKLDQNPVKPNPSHDPNTIAKIAELTGLSADDVERVVRTFQRIERNAGPDAAKGFADTLKVNQPTADRQVQASLGGPQ